MLRLRSKAGFFILGSRSFAFWEGGLAAGRGVKDKGAHEVFP